ncbi:MAG: hypothetical protein ACJATT_001249, partial [Myxococcota bacterium]
MFSSLGVLSQLRDEPDITKALFFWNDIVRCTDAN